MSNIQQLQDFTTQVRRDILRMVHAVNSGHPGGSLGCAEFFTVLYLQQLKRNSSFNMDGIGEDLEQYKKEQIILEQNGFKTLGEYYFDLLQNDKKVRKTQNLTRAPSFPSINL